MTDLPAIFTGLPIYWTGVDDFTPAGCTLVATKVFDIATTYILRDGEVIGRIEISRTSQNGYTGSKLKGGRFVGSGEFASLAAKIADYRSA